MFRDTLNRAVIDLEIETVTPLLVQSGSKGLDSVVELECVRTNHAVLGPSVYIPGSSFKGVIRSACEAVMRGRDFGGIRGACNPLEDRKGPCHHPDKKAATHTVHRGNCLTCRVFGSLSMKGRTALRDLYPWPGPGTEFDDEARQNFERANRVEVRHGVGINRVSGAAHRGAKFEMEVVPSGVRFHGQCALENYQVWQLGLLVSGFDEVNDGFAQLGSSKSRGLGVATVNITRLLHEQLSTRGERPLGVGSLVDEATGDGYGLLRESELPETPDEVRGLMRRFDVRDAAGVEEWISVGRQALEALS